MKSPSDRRRTALILVVILSGVGLRHLWTARSPQVAPVGATSAQAVAVTLARPADFIQMGGLRLASCEIGKVARTGTARAYCSDFTVPEDWSVSQGRQISLRVAIVTSRAAKREKDLLVFLDGGPGGAAIDDYPAIAPAFGEMRARRDLLLVDQRGTGGSNELRCKGDPEAADEDRQRREAAQRSAIDRGGIDVAGLQRELRECLQTLTARADPAQYATGNAVRDLEAVRQALGAPLLDLVGVSYGTRMAQQYAGTYPQAVRSVLLDSPVPNELVLGSETSINLDAALKARFEVCRQTPACAARFGDPYASLYKLRDRLREKPQSVTLRDPVTYERVDTMAGAADLAVTARLFAYAPSLAALLPLTIDEALAGHYTPLLGQRKLITDAVTEQLTDGMGLSVTCTDDADLLQPRPEDKALLLGDSMVQYMRAACEVWPHGRRSANFHEPWKSAVPTLVLGGQFDPITPLRYGEAIVRNLPNGRLLTLLGQSHGVLGSGCMPRLAGDFIDTLATKTLQVGCLDVLGDTPAFLGYSGSAP
jgi:pimeloyl-ACP methyl ester carboxylesterase